MTFTESIVGAAEKRYASSTANHVTPRQEVFVNQNDNLTVLNSPNEGWPTRKSFPDISLSLVIDRLLSNFSCFS
ncbi:MAG: hypothetical protein VX679_06135 [Pseudomonadota bacterium]|nr:hypothetical protein [Pseudomonadota bacterium]